MFVSMWVCQQHKRLIWWWLFGDVQMCVNSEKKGSDQQQKYDTMYILCMHSECGGETEIETEVHQKSDIEKQR